jgi:ATP-binding cassette subfamily F protein 3
VEAHRHCSSAHPRCARSSAASDFPAIRRTSQVRQLSGGERARLSLALITRDEPHILILDEPTNHLDVEAREALVEALAGFGEAVVVISRDRHLLGLIADRLVLVDGRTARDFAGSLDD